MSYFQLIIVKMFQVNLSKKCIDNIYCYLQILVI
jgi:hypothetical protein